MHARGFVLGAYELLARLPSSAPTQTFLARQRGVDSFKKLVCLRVLLPAQAKDDALVDAFLAEGRHAAHLGHPACVTIYDLGRERGAYFISMEYVIGETLSALLDSAAARRAPIPPPLVASILASVSDGLHSAHALRDPNGRPAALLHGDLSPRNIMLTYDGHPKILDFGVASTKAEHKGRVRYAAPELSGRPTDRKSDIYSLGLVMFELLAARALGPMTADERTDWVLRADRQAMLDARGLVPELDPDLAAICARALAEAPEDRFDTAEELGEALRAHLTRIGFAERHAAIGELMTDHFAEGAAARTRTLQRLLRGDWTEDELESTLGARSVTGLELLFEDSHAKSTVTLPARGATATALSEALRAPLQPRAISAGLDDVVPALPPEVLGVEAPGDDWRERTVQDGSMIDTGLDEASAPSFEALEAVEAVGAEARATSLSAMPWGPRNDGRGADLRETSASAVAWRGSADDARGTSLDTMDEPALAASVVEPTAFEAGDDTMLEARTESLGEPQPLDQPFAGAALEGPELEALATTPGVPAYRDDVTAARAETLKGRTPLPPRITTSPEAGPGAAPPTATELPAARLPIVMEPPRAEPRGDREPDPSDTEGTTPEDYGARAPDSFEALVLSVPSLVDVPAAGLEESTGPVRVRQDAAPDEPPGGYVPRATVVKIAIAALSLGAILGAAVAALLFTHAR